MLCLVSIHPALDPESEERPSSDLCFGVLSGNRFRGDPVHGVRPLALCCACCSLPASLAVNRFVQLHSTTGPQMVLRGLSGLG